MIEITGLTKRYGSLLAVDNLSLSIGKGELFGFIGPNGAGKTTTMKVLSCLLRPDSGVAKVDGLDVMTAGDDIRRIIGYMPDFLGVYEDLTVEEYLLFFAAAFNIDRRKRSSVVGEVLALTDLTAKRRAMVSGLSRGMTQRLGVARVLIHDPKVLLLDEPASGLDPRARIEMRSLLTELARMGKTLMVSSHILTELGEMSSSIGIIERGRLLFAGSMEEAFRRAGMGERVLLRLENHADAEGPVRTALLNAPTVLDVQVLSEPPSLRISLQGTGGHHEVIERVIGAGGRIAAFEPQRIKLEDAFLKLTTGAVQ